MVELLKIRDLNVRFILNSAEVKAVRGASLGIEDGETLALIGESGSGKSVLGQSILRILPKNAIVGGEILFNGRNLLNITEKEIRKIRGGIIGWIPQNPATSLNPVLKVGFQVYEVLETHRDDWGWSRVFELFRKLDLTPEHRKSQEYPHRLSGGMRQRVLVSIGIASDPKLIIADEPTKGIDPTRKKSVMRVFSKIKGTCSILLITHDLKFAEKLADRVAVMYCGKIVEIRKRAEFFSEPLHPYSKGLLDSIPPKLKPIRGDPPSMINPPNGCAFRERCDFADESCAMDPPAVDLHGGVVRCWLYVSGR